MTRLLLIIYLSAIFFAALYPVFDIDLGYVMRTGQYVVQNLQVPTHDIFSFSAAGAPWIAHYWFSGVIFYITQLFFGINGLIVLVGIIAAATYFFVIKKVALHFKDNITFFWLIFVIGSFYFAWSVRAQIFTNLFLAITLFLLERYEVDHKKISLYLIPPLVIFWANMHAGVAVILPIIVLWILSKVIEHKFSLQNIKTEILLAVSVFVATVVNPWGYKLLMYQFYVDKYNTQFVTLLGFSNFAIVRALIFLMVAFSAFILFRQLSKLIKGKAVNFFEIGLTVFALAMPLISVRHMIMFPIIVFPIFVKEWHNFTKEGHFKVENPGRFSVYLLVLGLGFIVWPLINIKSRFNIDESLLPNKGVDFIKTANVPGPTFNTIEYGGWLIWKLWPDRKVYIDGRNDVYYGGMMDEYRSILAEAPGWEHVVNDKYKFESFIMFYRSDNRPFQSQVGKLSGDLIDKLDFKLVYWDDASIVLVRDTPENSEIIKKYGYNIIRPFKNPSVFSKGDRIIALAEVERALRISPDSAVLRDFKRLILENQ